MEEIQDRDELRFGQQLLREGLVSDTQLKTAIEYQRSLGGRLHEIIRKLGFVDEARLSSFLARVEHMHTIELEGREIDVELMRKIPRAIIERHEVIPFRQSPTSVLLAMAEPMDYEAIEEVQFLTSCTVDTALAPRSEILALLTRFYETHPDVGIKSGPVPVTPTVAGEEPAAAEAGPAPATGERELLGRIEDPVVAALARLLIAEGVVDPEAWRRMLESSGADR